MMELTKRYKIIFFLATLALLCWGRLLVLRGIWWDDWAWFWHYFKTGNLSGFLFSFESLRHELDGYILFLNFKLLDIFQSNATNIWNVFKFIIFFVNSLLLYSILKEILHKKSVLPETIAAFYLVSPLVNNICLVEFSRRLYLCCFLLSIFFTVKSIVKRRFVLWCYLLSLFFAIVSMLGLESFIIFDFARFFLIFCIFSLKFKEKLPKAVRRAILLYCPFIFSGIFILIYKFFLRAQLAGFYAHTYDFNSLPFFKNIAFIVYKYSKSLFYLFAGITLHSIKGALSLRPAFLVLVSLLSSAGILFVRLVILKNEKNLKRSSQIYYFADEAKLAAFFGLFLIILGLFPYVMVKGISSSPGFGVNSRHALLASVGVAVFLPSIFLWLYYRGIIKKKICYFMLAAIIFMNIFQCNLLTEAYNNDWQQQRSFWWQLVWRVPEFKDKTYFLIDMPRENKDYFISAWMGHDEFSCPLNLIYAKSRRENDINKHFASSFENGFDLTVKWNYILNRDRKESFFDIHSGIQPFYPVNLIVASYRKGYLNINEEMNESNTSGMVNVKPLIANAAFEQIIYGDNNFSHPLRWVIGEEPKALSERTLLDKFNDMVFNKNIYKDWRYYLQKMRLFENKKDYAAITELYAEVESLGIEPRLPEAIPLFVIKSFYLIGDLKKADFLLWNWALSSEGDRLKAKGLSLDIKAIKDDPRLIAEVESEIKRIWKLTALQ